jgi:hypothetical protein
MTDLPAEATTACDCECPSGNCMFARRYLDVQRLLDEVLGPDDAEVEGGIEAEIIRAFEVIRVQAAAAERETIARLAEQAGATYVCYSHVQEDNRVVRIGKPHPFADVIRQHTAATQP